MDEFGQTQHKNTIAQPAEAQNMNLSHDPDIPNRKTHAQKISDKT